MFELSSEQALDAMDASGGYDHGIDAIIETDEKIVVIQTKYETSHSAQAAIKFNFDMRLIQNGRAKETDANEEAQRAIVKILDAYANDLDVKYYYLTNATFTKTDMSKIGNVEGNGKDIFFYDIASIVEELEKRQQDIPETIKRRWFTLRLPSREILAFEDTTAATAVIAVSLSEICDFVSQGGDDLFASNVRQYLKSTKINTGIKNTVQTNPEHFWIYNNGITIVCDDFMEENFAIKIQTPQIVNGCQTAKSIWDVLSKRTTEQRKAVRGHVLVRIIKGADETEKQSITRYTNTQNAVKGKDFFSLDQFQRKLKIDFESFGYYYEIQRGAFVALTAGELRKFMGQPALAYLTADRFKNLVPASEAVHAHVAGIKQFPAVAYGKPYEVIPGGSHQDKVYDDKTPADARLFLYPYLVREWAKNHNYSRGR